MPKNLDQRDPMAKFGIDAANAVIAALSKLNRADRRIALEDELNSIDLSLYPALVKRIGRKIDAEEGLAELDAVREALVPIFANHLTNVFIKAGKGDFSSLSGCGCSDGYSPSSGVFDDITHAIGGVGMKVKDLMCGAAPAASKVPNPYVMAGAVAASAVCSLSANGGSQDQIAILQAQIAAEQARQAQQQKLLIFGGIAAVAVLLVATRS